MWFDSTNFGFPFHPSDRDSQQKDDCQSPDDANVVQLVGHQRVNVLRAADTEETSQPSEIDGRVGEQLNQTDSHVKHLDNGLREAHDVHGHGYGVGEGKDETNGAPELGPQTPGDEIIGPS